MSRLAGSILPNNWSIVSRPAMCTAVSNLRQRVTQANWIMDGMTRLVRLISDIASPGGWWGVGRKFT